MMQRLRGWWAGLWAWLGSRKPADRPRVQPTDDEYHTMDGKEP